MTPESPLLFQNGLAKKILRRVGRSLRRVQGHGNSTRVAITPDASRPAPIAGPAGDRNSAVQEHLAPNVDGMFDGSILIVAHPDDETLWFSSVLDRVDRILVCFVDAPPPAHATNAGRRRVLLEYPLKNIATLGLSEPGLFGAASWHNPIVTDFGLKVRRKFSARSERSFHELKNLLRPQLIPYRNVFTHNPWGDYGNEEHVQLHHVVNSLRPELGFNLWFSNYCSNVSFSLMMQYTYTFCNRYITLETNQDLARDLTRLYERNACWTWYDGWQAFHDEAFLEASSLIPKLDPPNPPDSMRLAYCRGHLFPLNFMRIDF
jgi:hypothetical protein